MAVTFDFDFSDLASRLNKDRGRGTKAALNSAGKRAVDSVASATPVNTGLTARSWRYTVDGDSVTVVNDNVQNGVNVAVLLDSGHATGTGGFVPGQHYIRPAIKPSIEQFGGDIEEVYGL